jgi:hypothetical protein
MRHTTDLRAVPLINQRLHCVPIPAAPSPDKLERAAAEVEHYLRELRRSRLELERLVDARDHD